MPTLPGPQNSKGIVIMALGMFIFAAGDIQAKFLTQSLPPLQIVWVRQVGLFVAVLMLIAVRGPGLLRSAAPGLQIARGVMAATSATFFIFAIRYVPIADAVAVSFVAPFIVTVLAALVLREPVGLRRWLAVMVGFCGTLVVIRPGMGALHPAIFLVMIAATAFALRQILSRFLSAGDGIPTTLAYTAFVSFALLSLPLPFVWVTPETWQTVLLLAGLSLCAALGEACIIWALQIAQAVALAPVMYSLIIWGTMYGFLVFGDFPDGWTWVGTTIIIASGIYTLWRERQRAPQST